jgi:lipid-binding SYLF domain-containing protein
MRAVCGAVALSMAASVAFAAGLSKKLKSRIDDASAVLIELHTAPDKDVPQELWDHASCVIVIPSVKKAAFVFGGEYGKGLMSCHRNGTWSAPVFMQLEKGSWGLQIGAQSIDLILLVNNERGMKKLLGNKVTLGAEASVAAGPVGRDTRAATDAQLHAEILSYSRTQGLFAGINLSGGVLKPDPDDNEELYGKPVPAADVLTTDKVAAPPATEAFMKALQRN